MFIATDKHSIEWHKNSISFVICRDDGIPTYELKKPDADNPGTLRRGRGRRTEPHPAVRPAKS